MRRLLHLAFSCLLALCFVGHIQAQAPTLVNAAPADGFIGEQICFPITYTNTGGPGFGPYTRLIVPTGFQFDNATFGGSGQTVQNLGTITAPAPNNYVIDPTAQSNSNSTSNDTIFAPVGSTIILLEYPVGSMVQGGVALISDICLTVDPNATIGVPVDFCVQGMYEFGDTPTGGNGPIAGANVCAPIIPILFLFDKKIDGSDGIFNEVPGGGASLCHVHQYQLNIDIAAAGTLTGPITITDQLPSELLYLGNISLPPGCSAVEPTVGGLGGNLTVTCNGSFAGSTANIDLQVTFDAAVSDVLDETICDDRDITNAAQASVPGSPTQFDSVATHTEHVFLEHSNNAGAPVTIGQTVQYNISFRITEFTAGVDAGVITFIVPDGMVYNPASLTWGGAPVNPANVSIAAGPGTGSTVTVDVHTQNAANILPCGSPTLQYTSDINPTYTNGDPVLSRDRLVHNSTIVYDLVEGATACSTGAGTPLDVIDISFNKTVNNSPPTGPGRNGQWWPGDVVQYRLELQVPSLDLDDVVISDFFPLPIHDVTNLATTFGTDVRFDPATCWNTPPVTYTRDAATNGLILDFGDISDAVTGGCVDIVLLIDIPITNVPFTDGLFHSNFMQVNSDNSGGDDLTDVALTLIQVGAPDLEITKGIVSSNNTNVNISPNVTPPNGNATNVNAGDQLFFDLTVINTGTAPGFDVQIRDVAPPELTNCALVTPNPVVDGSNNPVAFTGGFAGNNLTIDFAAPDDSIGFAGAASGNDQYTVSYVCEVVSNIGSGRNFDNTAAVDWSSGRGAQKFPPQTDDASVRVATPTMNKVVDYIAPNYSGTNSRASIGEVVAYELQVFIPEGHLNNVVLQDQLDLGLAFVGVDSIVIGNSTGFNNISTSNAGGFAAVQSGAVISGTSAATRDQDRVLTIDFGNLINADTDNQQDTITIFYRTIVINEVSNVDGDRLRNSARLEWDNPNNPGTRLNTTRRSNFVTVVEPQVVVTKSFTPDEVLPGNNSFVTLTVRNPSTSSAPAFDVNLTDVLPTGMTFVAGFSAGGTANVSTPPSNGGGTITAQWDTINVGEVYSITFEVQASNAITPCFTLTNCANITWESIADADQPNQPSAFSSNLGVPRSGNVGAIGGAANTYTQDTCAELDVIIDNTFDPFITANTPICEGDRAILTVQQYTGNVVRYNWSGPGVPAGFNNYQLVIDPVTTADTGTYFVYVELDGCVTDTSNSFVLQLRPQPADPVILPGDTTVCEGSSLQFTTPTIANQYSWTGPNGFTANASTTPLISPIGLSDAGRYTLVVTNSQGCSSNPVSSTVTVTPRPVAPTISNNAPICRGDVLQLSTNASATSYQWIAPNGRDTITTTSTLTIDPISSFYLAGDWTLAVVNANACTSAPSARSAVIINNTPVKPLANNSGPICEGQAVQLTANTVSGASYAWYSDAALTNLVATGQNPTISGLTAANSPITYFIQINSNGCLSDTSSTVVVINNNPAAFAPSYTSLCTGDSLFLLANTTGNSYQWTGPSGFVSTLQNPVIVNANAINAGSYTLTIQDNNGCGNTGVVQVAVEESPTTPVITSNSPLCEGDNLTLNTTSYTGNNVVYNWTTPTGVITTNVATLVINNSTLADSGTYSVVVTVDGCTSLPGNTEVIINTNPTATAAVNGTVFCAGDTLQLGTTTNANSYQWTGPNGFASTSPNPTAITPVANNNAGTYSLVVTDNNGCSSAPDGVTISVNPASNRPAVNSNSPVCQGDALQLSTNSTATSYQWTAPNGADTTTITSALTITTNSAFYQDGAWRLIITDANGCTSPASVPVQVSINALPNGASAGNNGPVCAGTNAQLSANTLSNAQYNWYTDRAANNLFSTAQNPTINTINTTTTYYLIVLVNGCPAPLDSTTVVVFPTPAAPALPVDFAVCEGETITLTTSTIASQYNWTGPNGFGSTAQNPAVIRPATLADAGNYTLSIVDNNGCVSPASAVQVTVNAAPAAPILTNNSAICAGDNLTLSTTATAATYQWTAPNGLDTTTTTSSLQILPSNVAYYQSGDWTLVVQNTATCPSAPSAPSSVVINSSVNAPTVFNDGPVCASGSATVSTPSAMGATYQWYNDAALTNLIATTASVTINNITRDSSFYVVVTVNGCVSPAGVTTVQVVPAPVTPQVPNDTTLCTGEPLTLTTTTSAASYTWTGPNGFQSNAQQPTVINAITSANAGTYTLSIVDSNGCASASNSFNVGVNAAPVSPTIVSNSPLCFGDTLTLRSSSDCGQSQWIGPNGNSASTLGTVGSGNVLWTRGSQTAIPSNNANYLGGAWYMICIDTLTGCRSPSNTLNVTINPTPIVSAFNGGAICAGDDGQLLATPIAGASYAWYNDSSLTTLVATTRTATISNLITSTTFYVVATVNGCPSAAASTTIPVNANPITPAPSYLPLCQLDTLFLLANAGPTVAIYDWRGPNGFNSNLENPIVPNAYPFNAGSYTLTVLDSLGCSAFSTVEVTIYPKPATPLITHNAPFCAGSDDLTLQTQAYFGTDVRYWWTLPNGTTDTTLVPSLVITTAQLSDTGLYQLRIFVDGCVSLPADQLIRLNPIPATPSVPADFAVCAGDAIVLTTNTQASAYFWTGPNGFQSNLPSPTVVSATAVDAGRYQLVVANQQGCLSADSGVVVTVNTAPPAPTITDNSPLCFGDTLVLTSSSSCGQSQWIGPNGNSASTLGTPGGNNLLWTLGSTTRIPSTDPNYLSGDWYMVCIDTLTRCQSISNTITVDIQAIPATPVAFNNSPICVGEAVQLSTATITGASYAWYADAALTTLVATSQNPSIANITTDTTFYLTITVNGCTSLAGSTLVRVYPVPATPSIPADFAVCEGDAIVLTSTTNAAGYNWTGPNGFQSNQQSPQVVNSTLVDSGRYTLFIIDNNGCRSGDTSVFVQVNERPAQPVLSSNSAICSGDDLVLSTTTTAVTYQWIAPNGADTITTTANLTIDATSTFYQVGDWTLVVLNAANCASAVSAPQTVIINSIPATQVVFNNSPICQGADVNLTTSFINGATYEWYSDAALTNLVATTQNPTIRNITTDSTFYLVITQNGCRSAAGSTLVTVFPTPATPSIPADFAVCEGDAIVLTSTTSAASYNWTGPNGFQSNQQSPSVVINATLVDSGRYTLFIIDNNGCQSGDTSVFVQVNETPTTPIITANNSPICEGSDLILTANASAPGSIYTWYLANGTPVGTGQTLTLNAVTTNQAGDYYVTLSLNGCESPASAPTTALIDSIPTVTAFAGLDQGLCDSSSTALNATVPTGAQGMWTTSSTATIANPMVANSAVYNLPTGVNTFYWTLSNGACRDFSIDSMQIDVTPISTDTANAGLDQLLCGQNTATLTAATPTTATGRWTQSSTQAGQGIVITNPNNPTTTATGLQQGQVYNFTWILSNGNCGDYSSDGVQITIDVAPPDNAYAGTNILLCNQNSVNLAAFASQYGTGLWTSTSSATIIDPTIANSLLTNLPQDTSVFVWTLSNGTCRDYSTDTVLVVVSTTNDTADAGLNQVVCSVNAVNLGAVTPLAGTGQWSQSASQAAQGIVIVSPNDPNSQIVGLGAGTVYAFTWTLTNGTCVDYSTDITTVTVNATPPDNAFAGNDINLCGAATSSNLAATVPTIATGFWTTTSTATISNPTQPGSTVSGLSNGPNVFVWTLSSGSCIDYDNDTIIITVTAPSGDIADAGLDSAYCNQSSVVLNATAPSVGGGYWAQTPSQASLGAVINNPTNPNTAVNNLTAGITYTFTWTLTNGGCVDYSSDQVLITIDILPSNVAYAGEDTVLCGGNATQLDGLTPPIGTGFWTTNDPATITTPIDPNSLVVNIGQDTTTYFWTLSNGACVDYSLDSVQVILSPLSGDIAFAGFDRVLCGVDSIILAATVPTTSTGVWTQDPGQLSQGIIITDPTDPNSSVTGIIAGQVYNFTWTLSTLGCANFSTDEVTYTINDLPTEVAYAGPDIILCTGNSTIMDATTPIFSTGQWSSNGGAIIVNPTLSNSTIVNIPNDTTAYYWSLSNGSCLDYSIDTMLIIVTPTFSVDTANAGLDIAICNADTAQLLAIAPTVATGRWIQPNNQASAGVIIDDVTAAATRVRGLQLDSTYTFTWSLTNGPCADYDTDDVLVQVSALPTDAAYAGEDFVICGIDTAIVTATTPSVGTGLWTTNSVATIVTPTNTRTELVNLAIGPNVFVWTLSNGACRDYSMDTIVITTDEAPIANADSFVVIYNSMGNSIDVLPNDDLNNNWVISITEDIGSGRLTNNGDGTFDILLQDVLVDQQFIYQLCNPNCPAIYCDTALVLLDVQGGTECVLPNTMTPNNDGVNDAFIVPCLDGLEGTLLTVFNRWGDVLYQNDNYNNDWQGTHNGNPVPDATYFYLMELADGRKYQGFIEVRR